jgi:hypothetical protein
VFLFLPHEANTKKFSRSFLSVVFDSFEKDKQVVAVLFVYIYWRTYFNDLLPPGADGVVVVLENTCNQTYTYQVDGVESWFVGHGDLHNPKYDYLGTGTNLDKFIADDGEALDHKGCHYSIRVYPSQQFEDSHRTDKPWIYTVILAAVFVFTSAVFLFYDYMVERRQKIVLQSALQSGNLVSSLFPEQVRDQLYKEQQAKADQQTTSAKAGWKVRLNGANQELSSPLSNTNPPSNGEALEPKTAIASLYPEATIFFTGKQACFVALGWAAWE